VPRSTRRVPLVLDTAEQEEEDKTRRAKQLQRQSYQFPGHQVSAMSSFTTCWWRLRQRSGQPTVRPRQWSRVPCRQPGGVSRTHSPGEKPMYEPTNDRPGQESISTSQQQRHRIFLQSIPYSGDDRAVPLQKRYELACRSLASILVMQSSASATQSAKHIDRV